MKHHLAFSSKGLPAGLVLVIAAALGGCTSEQKVDTPVRAVRTQVLTDAAGDVDREFAGEIRARIESRLSFRVPGKLTRRAAELGQHVVPGQVLAQLDPTDLRLGQEAARAGLMAAQANVAQAELDFKRFQSLQAQGFISSAELERHQTALKTARANLIQAQAQAATQGNQAGYSSLTASGAGVITSVDAEPGQVVAAGQPVVTLALDGPRDVVFSVPEDMGSAVRPLIGQAGALKLRRWGTQAWLPATIREMAAAADPLTRTFLVKADVGRAEVTLGQTATVALATPSRAPGGVRLPLHALVEQAGKSSVWVLDPRTMTVAQQPVVTAEVTGNTVVVVQGVKAGQEVVTAGVHVLVPGQKVRRLSTVGAASAP